MQLLIPGRPPLRPWNGNFFPPGEYRRLAETLNTNRWMELVEQHFENDMLPPNQAAIQISLQNTAPLGSIDSSILKEEGIVFKRIDAPYVAGRPSSGGAQLKHQFCATLSAIVGAINARRSIEIKLWSDKGLVSAGNVTIWLV